MPEKLREKVLLKREKIGLKELSNITVLKSKELH